MKLSIVILEYHSVPDLRSCIASIRNNLNGLAIEIIVSSNSCYDQEFQGQLISEFSQLKWVFNEENLGFAKGTNQGIKLASGDYIMILNVDAKIITDLNAPIKYLQDNRNVGIVGPQIIDSAGNIQDSCRPFMTPIILLKRMRKRFFNKENVLLDKEFDYSRTQLVDWVIGACMVMSKDALNSVGMLDDKYFLYVEDMDWCKRVWRNGFSVVYLPEFKLQYKGDRKSISPALSGKTINRYSLYHFKSYIRFIMKHYILNRRNVPRK